MSKKTTIITVSALAIAAALTFGVAACSSAPAEQPTKTAPVSTPEPSAPAEPETPAVPATPREQAQLNSGLTAERYAEVSADFANYGIDGLSAFVDKVEAETGKLTTVVVLYPCPVDKTIMTWGTAGELQNRPNTMCNNPLHVGRDLDATLARLKEIQERKRLTDDEVSIIIIG